MFAIVIAMQDLVFGAEKLLYLLCMNLKLSENISFINLRE